MRHRTFVALALVAAGTLAPAAVARGQDADPQPTDAGDAAAAGDSAKAAELLRRLEAVYARATNRPAPIDHTLPPGSEAMAKDRRRFAGERDSWLAALGRLPELSLDYREAAGDAAAAVAWFYAGFARVKRADTVGRAEGRELLAAGVADLDAYLERAERDAPHRADARHALAYAHLRLAAGEESGILAAAKHADDAVRAQLENGRHDDAGRLAYLILKSLVGVARESDAAALAAGWQAEAADFGASTDGVRFLVRRSRVRPGAPMPELPALESYTGAPMPWEELAGKPYVLHFFSTTVSTTPREVETILVPLRDRWSDRGLRLVGCSTDRALDDAEIERTRKLWDEWGKKETLHDGRKTSVRAWAEQRDVDWPWFWDGKWTKNALAQHLGVEVSAPFAILVDADGVIRWRGQPFQGLAEAVEELFAD